MCEDGDEWDPVALQATYHGGNAYLLGEGQNALVVGLHAARCDRNQRHPPVGRVFHREADLLTGDDTDRTGCHRHIDDNQDRLPAANRDGSSHHILPSGDLGRWLAGTRPGVPECQRLERDDLGVGFPERSGICDEIDPFPGWQPEVPVASRADTKALVQGVGAQEMVTAGAGELELPGGILCREIVICLEIGFANGGIDVSIHRLPMVSFE